VYDRGWHATNEKSYRKCWTQVAHRTMPKGPAAVIDTLRTARKGVRTGPTASTPARALEKKKSHVCDPMRRLINALD